jgi:hypothetical protein
MASRLSHAAPETGSASPAAACCCGRAQARGGADMTGIPVRIEGNLAAFDRCADGLQKSRDQRAELQPFEKGGTAHMIKMST